MNPFQRCEMWWRSECGTISSATASQDKILAAWFVEESSEHSALEPWGDEGTLSPLHLRVFLAGRNSRVFVLRVFIIGVGCLLKIGEKGEKLASQHRWGVEHLKALAVAHLGGGALR
jgi:hypothetical protein